MGKFTFLKQSEDSNLNYNGATSQLLIDLYNNQIEINSWIDSKMIHFDEYQNKDSLNSAMDIYVREYAPEIHNLRMLKYSVMDMVVPPGGDPKEPIRVLNQSAASLRQLETLHGEVPRVLKFNTGEKPDSMGQNNDMIPEEDGEEGEESVIPWSDSQEEEEE